MERTLESPKPAPVLRRRDRFESYEDAARLARRRLPRTLYSEIAGGPDRGVTARENVAAFDQVMFRPRAASAPQTRNLQTTVLGCPISMPLLTAPVGALRIMHPQGAPAVARASGDAGTISAVSMSAGHSVEAVAAAKTGPLWQHVSMSRGREHMERVIEDAARCGYEALMLTVDTPVIPRRRPLFRMNLNNCIEFAPELMVRPRWAWRFVRDGLQLGVMNEAVGSLGLQSKLIAEWEDFAWVRENWAGPIVVKGIVTADDARRAVDEGAGAVVVSNHGGMGLDGTIPTLRALPAVVNAVGDAAEVLVDGGIRQGTDVVKAIALGARAVMIGRSYVMGFAVAADAGVRQVLENFRYEIDRTLGLLGVASVQQVDRSFIDVPPGWD